MTDEERAAEVLGAWAEAGGREDAEALIRAHPGLEAALRAGLAAHAALGAIGGEAGTAADGGALPGDDAAAPRGRVGEFRLVRELGRGGMGIVYEAEQIPLRRRVALKLLAPAFRFDPRALERFEREAQAAGALRHPNVVPVFAYGEADGVQYLAMEWVRGTTLAQRIADGPGGEPPDARALAGAFAGVADGLALAHAHGIVHRDIKPENLVFDEGGLLKLMDFGLALVEGAPSATLAGAVLGTPAYMSPEQARGDGAVLDGRTDVYALGATLYEALTRRPPRAGRPLRPRRLDPRIPRDLETVVLKALQPRPDDRYATAGAFAADLSAVAAGRPIQARAPGWAARAGRLLRGHAALTLWSLAVALGTAALLLVVGLGRRGSAPAAEGARVAWALGVVNEASPWNEGAQLSVASYGLGAAWVRGRLVAVSGFFTPRVAMYDPAADRWSEGTPLERPLQYFGTVVIDGSLYVVGGDWGGAGSTADLLRMDEDAQRWTRLEPMPGGPRYGAGVAALDGRIYVAGGSDTIARLQVSRLEIYDVRSGRWTAGAPLPAPRQLQGSLVELGGRLYAVGGDAGLERLSTLDVYDPRADRWEPGPPLPAPTSGQAVAARGRLFVTGNARGSRADQVLSFDPGTGRWSVEPGLRRGRQSHAVAADPASGRLYVVGGYAEGVLPFLECWTPP